MSVPYTKTTLDKISEIAYEIGGAVYALELVGAEVEALGDNSLEAQCFNTITKFIGLKAKLIGLEIDGEWKNEKSMQAMIADTEPTAIPDALK